jgi:hypothetical protein
MKSEQNDRDHIKNIEIEMYNPKVLPSLPFSQLVQSAFTAALPIRTAVLIWIWATYSWVFATCG